ncbi:hypothetical protein [Chryseobacterium gregarium]|uniref:hypothetical protein n=1 Tax=Chryseobacterium gregarium TaxID=456299 RepID=UPI0003FE45FD|nr:hypothetical protein [Chryseobacterium gregarium]
MKLKATIREEVQVNAKSIVVEFSGDPKKQHFEVKCSFIPYQEGMRKWDTWELKIRFESEIFTEAKTGEKSYFTHLICDQARKHSSILM